MDTRLSTCNINVSAPNRKVSVHWVGPTAGFSLVGGAGTTEKVKGGEHLAGPGVSISQFSEGVGRKKWECGSRLPKRNVQ